jgi:AraC-like DNA-binding protein
MTTLIKNMLPILLLIGATQGLFFAFVLARIKRGNRLANRILAVILFLFSIDLVEGFLSTTYALTKIPCLIGVDWPFAFLYGPLLYFYVKVLTSDPAWHAKRWKIVIHFLPAILLYFYLFPFYLADPAFKARAWVAENGMLKNHTTLVDPILYVIIFQIAGYLALSLRLLAFHAKSIQQNFSSIEAVSLAWLRNLIFAFIGLLCLYAFHSFSSQFLGLYKEAEFLLNMAIAMLILVFAYKGIQQPEIFTAENHFSLPETIVPDEDAALLRNSQSDNNKTPQIDAPADKYRKSALTNEQAESILVRVRDVMGRDKPYREMGLTLPMLARMLDVSPHHLSQAINEKLNKSFFDFVNGYRVEETKFAISGPDADRFSILGLAMEAGFNSKSAFYTAFKKHTGMTPTRFKELAKRSNNGSISNRQ